MLFAAIFSAEAINIGIHKMLLKLGASPNVANKYGTTLLNEAIYWLCPAECLNTLIDAGADVNAVDFSGLTAFNSAALLYIYCPNSEDQEYALDVVKLLLSRSADPYLCNYWTFPRAYDTPQSNARRNEIKKLCAEYLAGHSA